MTMKKLLLPMLIAAALSGCASFPDNYEKPIVSTDVAKDMKDQWSSTPAISRVASTSGVAVRKFNDLPDNLRTRPIALKISDTLGLSELVAALRAQGIRVASSLKESADVQLTSSFNGDLGSLLDMLAAEHNIAYEFRNDSLFLTETGRYVVTMPQHEEFLKKVESSVTDMGATSVRADVRAGRLYYSAKPDVAQYLEEYISILGKNSAMVNLQVAVITVRLTRDMNVGMDWSKLQIGGGTGDLAPGKVSLTSALSNAAANATGSNGTNGTANGGNSGSNGTSGGTNGTSGGTTGSVAAAAIKLGKVAALTGGEGFAAKFVNDSFSLSAAINALSTYGSARTEQNVTMSTLGGLPVKIGSGNEIPYVKSIGSTTASGGATQGSSQTDIVKSGLKLEITPNFEAEDLSVVTTMKVDMSSLVAFRELSAGTNLGTMSQPEMQKLEFENVGRLQVGETLVVGGITYDQLNTNYTALPGLEKQPLGSKADKTNRFAVYIVIRPTVTVFEQAPQPKPPRKEAAPVSAPALVAAPAAPEVRVEPEAPAEAPAGIPEAKPSALVPFSVQPPVKAQTLPAAVERPKASAAPAARTPEAPKYANMRQALEAANAAERRAEQLQKRYMAAKAAGASQPELVRLAQDILAAQQAAGNARLQATESIEAAVPARTPNGGN